MEYDARVYGYCNGKPAYSREEFVYMCRGFGAIESDDELLAFAEKVTCGWQSAGWKRTFTTFYLSDYALSEPYASLTQAEFDRLRQLQNEAIVAEEKAEAEKQWKKVETLHWADNSVEEVYENKFGECRTVMTVSPRLDAC